MLNYWSSTRSDPHRDLLLNLLKTFHNWLSDKVKDNPNPPTNFITIFLPILFISLHAFIENVIDAVNEQIQLQTSNASKKRRINLKLESESSLQNDSDSDQDIPIKPDQFITCGKCRQKGHRNRDCKNPRISKKRRMEPHPGYQTK